MEVRGTLRHGNLTQILRYVRDHGASSRHDIARGCGLGISTMTDLIGELRARRLVRELDPIRRPGAGRPTRPIAFDGEPWCVLGVQIDVDRIDVVGQHRGRPASCGPRPFESTFAGPGRRATRGSPRLLRSQLERIPDEQAPGRHGDRRAGGYVADRPVDGAPLRRPRLARLRLGAAVLQTLREAGSRQGLRRGQQRVPAGRAVRQPDRAARRPERDRGLPRWEPTGSAAA